MHIFVNPKDTKNKIRDDLMLMAAEQGQPLSKSRANNLADKFKKGLYDPELAKVLQHSDPTGEAAVNNVLKEQAA